MKLRFLTLILVVATLLSGVVLWRVDRFVYGDRMAWAEAQARNQMSSLTQAINSEIKSGRRMLSTVTADTFRPEATNWKAFQPYYALAIMTSAPGSSTMAITRMVTKSDSAAAGWNAVQLSQYLGFLGKELESNSTVILRSFKDPQKNRHVALIFAGGGTAYILVGNGENFQGLIDSQKGSMSSFAIMASDGLTISHPIPDYIGNVMSDSSMLKEIRNTGATQGVGTFLQGRKTVFGMYEKVAGTNSYVISTVPLEDLMRGRLSLAWQFVFLAMGVCFLGAALYFWYEKKNLPREVSLNPVPVESRPMPSSSVTPPSVKSVPPPSHAAAVVVSNQTLVAPSAPRNHNSGFSAPAAPATNSGETTDKADAYRQVASALGQEMRAPIASIVGFSQMVLSKTQDPEVVQAVESILREARSSRDVLEKLHTFSGERSSLKKENKIEGPISVALKNFEAVFREKGVVVEKQFKDTTPWPMATEDLIKVFENLFSNAVEAMERMQEKRLTISVWEDPQGLHVQVADTGEGISPENLTKVFDPFFTTRSFAHHVGLGLPVIEGILKEHQAEIEVKSVRSQGTQVAITFSAEAKSHAQSSSVTAESPDEVRKGTRESVREAVIVSSAPSVAPASRLTEVNVDRLLDMSSEDAPLEFLDGLGFSDDPQSVGRPSPVPMPMKPSAPPPTIGSYTPPAAVAPEVAPEVAPPPASFDIDEDHDYPTDPLYEPEERTVISAPPTIAPLAAPPVFVPEDEDEEFVAGPKPSLPNRAPAILPEELTAAPQAQAPAALEPEQPPTPKVVIDPPKARPPAAASSLDSYKVEIRRPGKRT